MKFQRVILAIVIFLMIGAQAHAQKDKTTTIFLVRHAEKVKDGTKDPALTFEGKQRANELKDILQHVDLAAVYSTNFKRTKNTAMPTATAQNLKVKLYNPMDSGKFLDGVLKKHKGKNILIVGHSNTIPALVNSLLGDQRYEALADSDYNNLFIVTITRGAEADVLQLTFKP